MNNTIGFLSCNENDWDEQNQTVNLNNIIDNSFIALEVPLDIDPIDCTPLDGIDISCKSVDITGTLHNNLYGIQGGNTQARYHITANQWLAVINSTEPNELNPFLTLSDISQIGTGVGVDFVHKTGNLSETITGAKTFSGSVTTNSLALSGLTSGRIPYITTGGLITDNPFLRYDGTTFIAQGIQSTVSSALLSGSVVAGNNGSFTIDNGGDGPYLYFSTGETNKFIIGQSGFAGSPLLFKYGTVYGFEISQSGKLTFNQTPTVQSSPTQILTRDATSGEVKYTTLGDIRTGVGGDFVYKTGNLAETINGAKTFTVNITAPTFTGDLIGNSLSATKLQTARTINGIAFDGTGNITIADATKEPAIITGSLAQYWRGDKSWQALNTSVVTEGTNLYYTDARADARIAAQKGFANGVTPLNSSAKIDTIHLPDSILGQLKYGGIYNGSTITASDNFPELQGLDLPISGSQYVGVFFITAANFTRGAISYAIGDWILHNGSGNYVKVDNTDAVTTVFGRLGAIVANAGDYDTSLVTENAGYLYHTNARVQTFADTRYSLLGHTHTFSEILAKPTTITGYGITDAFTKTEQDGRYAYIGGGNALGSWNINSATATNVAYSGLTGTIPIWNQNTTGNATNVTGIVAIANGGTGSSIQNFVDLTTNQTIGGAKNLTAALTGTSAVFSGNVTATGFYNSSDIRLKELTGNNFKADKISLISYNWKDGRDTLTHIGYSAQDVLSLMPDAVSTDDKGFLAVNYIEVLVAKVDFLERRLKELEVLNGIC